MRFNSDHLQDELDARLVLSADQIAQFRTDGFIRLKDVFSTALLEEIGAEITRATIALNTQNRPLEERTTYERAFLQVMNLWRSSEAAKRFVFSRRLAAIAADLLEVDSVRLYHDQSLYKEPSGGITQAHADQYYWPLSTDRTVTVWVPLQATPDEMGPLGFYQGSHVCALGRDLPISDDSEREITERMEAQGFPYQVCAYDLGEVSFHLGWTFHKAGANRTTQPRSVMTVIYMDAEMTLKSPSNTMQEKDWKTWCPGAEVGNVIDTPFNPVLFTR